MRLKWAKPWVQCLVLYPGQIKYSLSALIRATSLMHLKSTGQGATRPVVLVLSKCTVRHISIGLSSLGNEGSNAHVYFQPWRPGVPWHVLLRDTSQDAPLERQGLLWPWMGRQASMPRNIAGSLCAGPEADTHWPPWASYTETTKSKEQNSVSWNWNLMPIPFTSGQIALLLWFAIFTRKSYFSTDLCLFPNRKCGIYWPLHSGQGATFPSCGSPADDAAGSAEFLV